ncbi:hypothetical protein [Microbulbifer hainanensis]|uniref:hypothetical protein n=1 Tax=Microbulbifer hainanensis TaxID=2735675 RepID=UPI001866C0B0|nr:hypothetical protein [Microbulbifer hainanensis]
MPLENTVVVMTDDYQVIQQCVDRAVTLERHKGRFRRAIRNSLPRLHRNIRLPQQDGPLRLTSFVIRYIQAVPKWLRQLETLCAAAGIEFTPVRELIGRYFAEPQERHPDHVGLGALLDDAYLAHRVLEEINEQLQPACGLPLLPMDPMVANLVVRELLGETFAVELDAVSVKLGSRYRGQKLGPDSLVSLILCRQRFVDTPGEWPDFAAELQIGLRAPALAMDTDTLH